MEVRELRIGNLVVYPKYDRTEGADRYFFVRDLHFEGKSIGLTTGRIQTKVDFDRIKPVPLTEEWHKKLKKTKICNVCIDINFRFDHDCVKMYIDGNFFKRIDFVHQLQNLYFALTGEELEFKL